MDILNNTIENIDLTVLDRSGCSNTSKGDFGCVGIIGGASGMFGAPILAGRSALLCGAGKVRIGFVAKGHPVVDFSMPELMLSGYENILNDIDKLSILVVGVGFGSEDNSVAILAQILSLIPEKCWLILDADGLNIIAKNENLAYQFKCLQHKIITPHPMEASRLLDVGLNDLQSNREYYLFKLCEKFATIVLLKGYQSLISDGVTSYRNGTGSSALSNAGQGDSLCGIIGALFAQGMPVLDAVRFAVYIHGLASDDLIKSYGGYNGIIATDTSINVRRILNKLVYGKKTK